MSEDAEQQIYVAAVEISDISVISVGEAGPRGEIGPPGISGATTTLSFSYGDASPANVVIAPANKLILSAALVILTPFDGTGAALQIGVLTLPEDLMAAADNDPATAGTYEVTPLKSYVGITQLLLTITPGGNASQGAGKVVIEIEA